MGWNDKLELGTTSDDVWEIIFAVYHSWVVISDDLEPTVDRKNPS